jgi:hypothetical protein
MPRDKKVRLTIYVIALHIGLTLSGLNAPNGHWSLPALLAANAGLAMAYFGLIRFVLYYTNNLIVVASRLAMVKAGLRMTADIFVCSIGVCVLLFTILI